MEDERKVVKPHRKPHSGRKAEKKAKKLEQDPEKKASKKGLTAKQKNPKAFAIQNVKKLQKAVKRTLDIKERKLHIPVVDRTPLEPPPIIIAIVGPPQVGKSTLMRGLIKNFTQQKLTDIKGPVTVVSGKKRRLTIVECNNDINSMIDIAKVADLVLLLIDASFGMEMETFEFLNVCQVHGFPRVMGVLTHLDHFKNNKKLKMTKKTLKHRFWTEIYQGAKLFFLTGMIGGEYLKNELHNLGRFISVMKFRPLTWRNSHSYVLADRMEDITDPERVRLDPKVNRTVSLYGYMRGVPLKNKSTVHIPGCGDFLLKDVSNLPDPCPLPGELKKRKLNEVEKKLFAPMSGVGGVVYDKDAVYIDLAGSHSHNPKDQEEDNEDENLKSVMMSSQSTFAEKIAQSSVSLFSNSEAVTSAQFEQRSSFSGMPQYKTVKDGSRVRRKALFAGPTSKSDEEAISADESDLDSGMEEEDDSQMNSNEREDSMDVAEEYTFDDDDDDNSEGDDSAEDDGEDHKSNSAAEEGGEGESDQDEGGEESTEGEGDRNDGGTLKWKENLAAKAAQAFFNRQKTTPNLRKLVYELDGYIEGDYQEDEEEVGGLFKVSQKSGRRLGADGMDSTRILLQPGRDWSSAEVQSLIKDCFVTGEWEETKDAQTLLDADDALYGDFEDIEGKDEASVDGDGDDDSDGDDDDGDVSGDGGVSDASDDGDACDKEDSLKPVDGNTQKSKKLTTEERAKRVEQKRNAKKQRVKEMFDAEYDRQAGGADGTESHFDALKSQYEAQANLNRSEFDGLDDNLRVMYEGFRAGMYVRIEIDNIPCEFVTNFDPTCPIIIGGVTSSECVIGCVLVRLKKHRWYKKILKTKDPLIFSLGWRRFQSIPLYTVQDHNGRNRQLKYTPEHLHCMAVFWGPITPQNAGLLCMQQVTDKTSDFRIAATGVVLALDKSMVISKKLKLIGYPFKVHKKTAFIKDMFTSQLEVAKFEGAKIKTVSGIRGQVKKSVRTPDGAFRATFEDGIQMSDIVFLRTWYQVEIPKFYNPVTNLLLSAKDRSMWQGMKTVGMLRKEKGIRAPFSQDSQYQQNAKRKEFTPTPLEIPRSLQRDLPFKYKPKVRSSWRDPVLKKRVAVIRDHHEKKKDQLLEQMRAVYQDKIAKHKQDRIKKHLQHTKMLKLIEQQKAKKMKEAKKEIFRALGKVQVTKQKFMAKEHGELE